MVYGVIALVTPFTPGSWLFFIGLELIGVRLVWGERLKTWWQSKKTTTPPLLEDSNPQHQTKQPSQ
jgi:hypothetical protein